jgi:serine/threonine protein kinase
MGLERLHGPRKCLHQVSLSLQRIGRLIVFVFQEYFKGFAGQQQCSSKSDLWSLAGVIWDMMNSKRGWDTAENQLVGLCDLRDQLHKEILKDRAAKHKAFRAQNYPTHECIQDFIQKREDLPKYTEWLKTLVNNCSANHVDHRLTIVELLQSIELIMEDIFDLKNGEKQTQDALSLLSPEGFPIGGRVESTKRRKTQDGGSVQAGGS